MDSRLTDSIRSHARHPVHDNRGSPGPARSNAESLIATHQRCREELRRRERSEREIRIKASRWLPEVNELARYSLPSVASHGSVHTVVDKLSERWMSPPLPGGSELSRYHRYSPQAEMANELHELRTENAQLRAQEIEKGRRLHQARVEHSDAMDQLRGQIMHLQLERKRFEDMACKKEERCVEVERHNVRMCQNLRRSDDEFKRLQMRYNEVVEEYKRMRSERDWNVGRSYDRRARDPRRQVQGILLPVCA